MLTLGARLKLVRSEMGWSKADLSRAIGISRSAVGQIESGETQSLKAATVAAIESTTGFSGVWLTTGKGPKRKRAGGLEGSAEAQVDKIYEALLSLPKAHRDKIEAEIDFLLSLSADQE